MNEWQVVWEVVILGTAEQAIEVLRQNAAIGWMMLTMVEGIARSEGGVGALLLNQNKYFHLPEVFAVQITILLIGMLQDYGIGVLARVVCPWAQLGRERR
jgi:NitT/TauT family transport system permease protein